MKCLSKSRGVRGRAVGEDLHRLTHKNIKRGQICSHSDSLFGHLKVCTTEKHSRPRLRQVHTRQQCRANFECLQCDTNHSNLSNFNRHIADVQRKQRYKCEKCGKSWAHKYSLKKHECTHLIRKCL